MPSPHHRQRRSCWCSRQKDTTARTNQRMKSYETCRRRRSVRERSSAFLGPADSSNNGGGTQPVDRTEGYEMHRRRRSVRERSSAFLGPADSSNNGGGTQPVDRTEGYEMHRRRRSVRERSIAFLGPSHGTGDGASAHHSWRTRTPSEVGGTASANVWRPNHPRTPKVNAAPPTTALADSTPATTAPPPQHRSPGGWQPRTHPDTTPK